MGRQVRRRRAAATLAAALVSLAAPSLAMACGTSDWCAAYAAPPTGTSIPQNAPALVQFALARSATADLAGPR